MKGEVNTTEWPQLQRSFWVPELWCLTVAWSLTVFYELSTSYSPSLTSFTSQKKCTKVVIGLALFQKVHLCTLFTPKECILLPKWYILVVFNHPSDSFCTFISESDTVQKFGSVRFLEWVWNNVFEVSSAHQSCHFMIKNTVKILKYYYNFK